MTLYQLHYITSKGSLIALPVFGDKRTIWEALAKHLHYRTYRTFCEVTKVNPVKHKALFKLKEVTP